MPPQAPQGAQGTPMSQGSARTSSVTRTMSEDLRRTGTTPLSASGSGKVMWPSGSAPSAPQVATLPPNAAPKTGFLSSLLQSRHKDEEPVAPLMSNTSQKIPVQGEGSAKASPSVWDSRVPTTPLSALPIPQKPIVHPVAPTAPTPSTPTVVPTPIPRPPVAVTPLAPAPHPIPTLTPIPPKPPQHAPVISASILPASKIPAPAVPPSVGQVMQTPPKPALPPARPQVPTPIQPPRPASPALTPRTITPVSVTPRPAHADSDDDIGIDLGISDYLKGGPTFQIGHGEAPIPKQAVLRPVASVIPPVAPASSAPLGGVWNPPTAPKPPSPIPVTPVVSPAPQPQQHSAPASPASIFAVTAPSSIPARPAVAPSPAPTVQPVPAQYVSPKPTQSNADLDTERERLESERAQIIGAKSAIESSLRSLVIEKQQVENQIKPLLLREGQLASEVEELEKKEQGLAGEVRRTIERDRWVKVEERRKVEQERILIKRRQVGIEGELHAKEEEQVSLVRREKDIDARIIWIGGEYKRREVRMKLAGVNQEKSTIETHRSVLDNGLKRLKSSLEETERNERRLSETKRSLALKLPQNIAEEERYATERFDLEKQMHDMELRRWSLEDELKRATELFAKEDMAYLDVMHRSEALEGELKALG